MQDQADSRAYSQNFTSNAQEPRASAKLVTYTFITLEVQQEIVSLVYKALKTSEKMII